MRRTAFVLALLICVGCTQSKPRSVPEAEIFLKQLVVSGGGIEEAKSKLSRANIQFTEISASECGVQYLGEPRYRCSDGRALLITINDNAKPLHPFYRPSLQGFLAFDASGNVVTSAAMLGGGD